MDSFSQKRVWITGASSGIGAELARQLAGQGAVIALSARSVDKLEAVRATLPGEGHIVIPADLMLPDTLPGVVEQVMAWCSGELDILVNNAGRTQRSLIRDTEIQVDRAIMELDYFAHVIISKAVLPHMVRRNQGCIVSISSVAGKVGTPMRSAYNGAKHALAGFMDSLRAEHAAHNIEVLNVFPGSIRTDISVNATDGVGNKHGKVDPAIANGLEVGDFVRKLLPHIRNGSQEVVIAVFRERLLTYIRRLAPRTAFSIVARIRST